MVCERTNQTASLKCFYWQEIFFKVIIKIWNKQLPQVNILHKYNVHYIKLDDFGLLF